MNLLYIVAPLPGFFGTSSLYACHESLPAPAGFIWFRVTGKNLIELLYVFVHEDVRRKGVATALLNELRRRFPNHDVFGGQVNEMSEPWVKKNGFTLGKTGWHLTTLTGG